MIVYQKEEVESSKIGCYPTVKALYGTIAHDVRLHMERVSIYGEFFLHYLVKNHLECVKTLENIPDILYRDIFVLHDIGRSLVPVRFQNKAGGLTDEEFQQIRQHASLSKDALRSIYRIDYDSEILRYIEDISLYHHERYDGTGYPYGIKGEEIPLIARICSLVDAFDGMVSWKAYRAGMQLETVKRIVGEEAGKQFDPILAQYFLECIEDLPDYLNEDWESSAGTYFS